jgi:ABC-type multidrug transport system ATPase subunit
VKAFLLRIDQLQVGRLPPLSFSVADGECLSIEGPSGAGKTTLLRAIADLDEASGQVFLDGGERREVSGPQWRRNVRYCAAEPAWWTPTPRGSFPRMADTEESGNTTRRGSRFGRLLRSLGLTPQHLDQLIPTLSTGERQRLALVRALADEPKVLLLDEPTGSLDGVSAGLVEELIKFLVLSGRTVILVSHDLRQIERLAHARLQLASFIRTQPAPELIP